MGGQNLTEVEQIKAASRHLRGSIADGLKDPLTGAIAAADTHVSKFHGIYQQDDRDVRSERTRQKLEPAFSFMIRARIPGGLLSAAQWLGLDQIATDYANQSIRLTTRQAIQYHGVVKRNLKRTVAQINAATLDTIAACGDVNRNVMSPPMNELSSIHAEVQGYAEALSEHLMPLSRAYHEIWLDEEKIASSLTELEPIYGDTYLPRKFKAAFAIPPQNDVDIFAQDLGLITVIRDSKIAGFNVSVGGGMGMTHGEIDTYPRLGDVLGFILPQDVNAVAEAVVTTQRDYGDRTNRKHARLKYTIEDRGIEWFRNEVEQRAGIKFGEAGSVAFVGNGDVYGWRRDDAGAWHYGLFVENGRVADVGERNLLSGLREIARRQDSEFRLTPNQNLIISNVADNAKADIDALLAKYGIENSARASALRLNSMACVAFPTCGLAMAESERYLPTLIDKLDAQLETLGLREEPITIRMTGCPNGCARPYIAEIGLVGKGPGRYTMFLGAGFAGDRIGAPVLDNANEAQILETLRPLFEKFASTRNAGEHFGDFLIRTGVTRAINAGREIHEANL